jgi:Ca2+-binding RTX toxin-like protein
VGGQGRDILRGGEGRDWFSYRYIETAAPDTIKDFVHGTDKIEFLFEFAEAVGGDVSPSELQLGTAANDPNDFVIYDRETGRLYIDVDGDGAGAQIHFATLSTKPKLDSDDFL